MLTLIFLIPRTGLSTVSTRASNPAASDLLIKFSVTALSLKMHNCSHFLTEGAEAATFSMEQELAMLRMKTAPFSCAALAVATSPTGCANLCDAVGAIPNGRADRRSRTFVEMERLDTSLKTRGFNLILRILLRFNY